MTLFYIHRDRCMLFSVFVCVPCEFNTFILHNKYQEKCLTDIFNCLMIIVGITGKFFQKCNKF